MMNLLPRNLLEMRIHMTWSQLRQLAAESTLTAVWLDSLGIALDLAAFDNDLDRWFAVADEWLIYHGVEPVSDVEAQRRLRLIRDA